MPVVADRLVQYGTTFDAETLNNLLDPDESCEAIDER